ncbi:unnamed protein product [Musa acuminata subsp. malaccensis]|uniref:(wild Malaysian banana) hypothetical protein n=1 Tax=Musa acuminata subsp. malaccensis TaxID=214687 RepID=A0A804JBS1_MUSAM|nr:PREDICTED: myb family transcription factor EFM-like [Musa acuminata subsp. malaccensis]CAG1845065.1 unnamed protein product [Musa acuminata subsp. malaccensis]
MGSAAADASLELRLFAARSVTRSLKEAPAMEKGDGRKAKLEEYVTRLEEEKRKIEAFQRELPHSMHLLTDVIDGLKKELGQCKMGESCARVLGEFMPKKSKFEEKGAVNPEADCKEKRNWMSSAQLWSDNSNRSNYEENENEKEVLGERGEELSRPRKKESLHLESKSLSGGSAFVPFKAPPALSASTKKQEKPSITLPDLLLQASAIDNGNLTPAAVAEGRLVGDPVSEGIGRAPALATANDRTSSQTQQQQPRKVRRCWSPDLHRRFLVALRLLGGAHVATPRQIRGLMEEDGLTNDEVKSHLQKYRLRMTSSSNAKNRPAAIGGGGWVHEEQHSASLQQSVPQSGSPESPLRLPVASTTGDSCEEEDRKSESHNCV